MTCDHAHPEHPDVRCDKDTPCYGYHANAPANSIWPGEPVPPAASQGAATRKGRLALIAQRAR